MMALWIAMAVLAAAAILPMLAPLFRSQGAGTEQAPAAVAIYRDQLSELDRDVARGDIGESEAAAARIEIARRLIRADGERDGHAGASGGWVKAAAVAIIATPVAALALYLSVGSPQYPAQPLAARAPVETQDVAALVAQVEAHLMLTPDDGEGWAVIAPVYVRMGRHAEAVRAYRNVIRLLGSSAEREADLGEALVRANAGTVPPEARDAFQRAADLAPADPRPRFYLALALSQAGETEAARTAWTSLIASAPADAPWLAAARNQLAALDAPGPTADDINAAASLSEADRQAMIEGMVASLDARLRENPEDPDGWARLVRSYMVLNEPEAARDVLARARGALAGDAAGLATVEAAAREAGLETGAQ